MSVLGVHATDSRELAVEARAALRAIVAISQELGRDRFVGRADHPVADPRDAESADQLELAVVCELLAAANALGGVGCLRGEDVTLSDAVSEMVRPVFTMVDDLAEIVLAKLSDHSELLEARRTDVTDLNPGWCSVSDLILGLQALARVGGALWGEAT